MNRFVLSIAVFFMISVNCVADWQDTLSANFDHADTMDRYQDWIPGYTSTLPELIGLGPDWIGRISYFDSTLPLNSRPYAIDLHSDKSVNGSKSLRLNWLGNGEGNQEASNAVFYFGDGTEDSGYTTAHVFFACYVPSDRFITSITGQDTENTRYAGRKTQGVQPLYSNSAKMIELSVGYTSAETWSDDDITSNDCRWGWSEVHFWLFAQRGASHSYQIRPVLDSGGQYFSQVTGANDVSGWLDKLFWCEITITRETAIGTANGSCKVVFYDESGNGTTVLSASNFSFLNPSGACESSSGVSQERGDTMKFNWMSIESNWRVSDGGSDRYIRGEDLYNSSGEYVRALDCSVYYDDIIVDDQEIAPTYFSLLSGQAPTYDPPTVNAGDDATVYASMADLDGTYTIDSGLTATAIWEHGSYSGFCTLLGGVLSGTVTNLAMGSNTITVTITDSENQEASDSVAITREAAPVSSVAGSKCISNAIMK